jgi:hypothetical protein
VLSKSLFECKLLEVASSGDINPKPPVLQNVAFSGNSFLSNAMASFPVEHGTWADNLRCFDDPRYESFCENISRSVRALPDCPLPDSHP